MHLHAVLIVQGPEHVVDKGSCTVMPHSVDITYKHIYVYNVYNIYNIR